MAEKSNNQEFLESLSDDHLAEEITWLRVLSIEGRHRESDKRELEEALAEQKRRQG